MFTDDESGGLVLRQGVGSIVVPAESVRKFVDACNAALSQSRVKTRQEQNEGEAWKAAQSGWPNWK
jgi:hypothetical protein